ncbi:hypothetical protein DXT68_03475 [Microbacterium foliorum]|uniref:Uncharacterized protein n=1 Tax=Microbacterium foliorum TaxID=104336 RepID=A0A0F0KIQ7_9MICO|nr:hypothetical protein [Microbacterium foliorum]AXL11291.1 hypothetical protein DXT68_03475 [Microbacterium foliorum]KJL19156.1 hypothetical protein RN50_02435 [Microbacterium foliorum]
MSSALRQLALILSALLLAPIACFLLFLGSIALTVATGTAVSVPGMTENGSGVGAELASAQFVFPGSLIWLIATAVVIYLIGLLIVRRSSRASEPALA